MEITNPKVLTATPTCARFPGFSLLFDNPGESLRTTKHGLRLLCNLKSDDSLALYQELSTGLREFLPEDSHLSGICPLPPESYHVTYFDCGNCANASGASSEIRPSLNELLAGLPNSLTTTHQLVLPAARHATVLGSSLDLGLCFSHIRNFGNEVLVAVLEPSNEKSRARFEQLTASRAELSSAYRENFGFGASQKYRPHVSLAYFANHGIAKSSAGFVSQLDSVLRMRLSGVEILFNSVGVYAFADMASFFRLDSTD